MNIRPEQKTDRSAISDVTAKAFAGVEHSDQSEPQIIERLRNADALSLSLVALDGTDLIGHVAFSPVKIDGADKGWFGLGPVSVVPERQGGGIGSALIREGLKRLRSEGAAGCVVLGDSGYYPRFGFERSDDLRYEDAPAEYFMSLTFNGHARPSGKVDYHPAFTG
ncbi:MAG: N-acetyltransferase [Erythrobacter sp.]|nr:N-acetyltransferase [Erythrobacter sp.]